jgi:hypothetical protein
MERVGKISHGAFCPLVDFLVVLHRREMFSAFQLIRINLLIV